MDLESPPGPVDLTAIPADATPGFDGDKQAGKDALSDLGDDLSDLQERLYAEDTDIGHGRSVLLVLQGDGHLGQGRARSGTPWAS